MTILRSTGPVISTRRSVRSSGTGEMRQSALRTCGGGGEELRQCAVIELQLTLAARIQQLQATCVEAPVQACQQLQGERI